MSPIELSWTAKNILSKDTKRQTDVSLKGLRNDEVEIKAHTGKHILNQHISIILSQIVDVVLPEPSCDVYSL